jgi:hypothetical protein
MKIVSIIRSRVRQTIVSICQTINYLFDNTMLYDCTYLKD